jgi:hypothetical protein
MIHSFSKRYIYKTNESCIVTLYSPNCWRLSLSLCLWLYRSLDFGRLFSFLLPYTVRRIPWTGDLTFARPVSTYTQNNANRINADKHPCSMGIQTHDPSFRAGEDCSKLTLRGHCDRLTGTILPSYFIYIYALYFARLSFHRRAC